LAGRPSVRAHYEQYGAISGYYCNQDELEITIQWLVGLLREGVDYGPVAGPPIPGAFPDRR